MHKIISNPGFDENYKRQCKLKSVDKLLPIHKAQLINYLKLSNKWLGLLMNFNEKLLPNGTERIVNG